MFENDVMNNAIAEGMENDNYRKYSQKSRSQETKNVVIALDLRYHAKAVELNRPISAKRAILRPKPKVQVRVRIVVVLLEV